MTDTSTSSPKLGDTAKVWSGIRDIDIKVGEASPGQKLPFAPYSKYELIAIGVIMAPTFTWARTNMDSGYALPVMGGAAVLTLLVVIALRVGIPKRRPSLATRMRFLYRTIWPLHITTSTAGRPRQRTPEN